MFQLNKYAKFLLMKFLYFAPTTCATTKYWISKDRNSNHSFNSKFVLAFENLPSASCGLQNFFHFYKLQLQLTKNSDFHACEWIHLGYFDFASTEKK